VKKLYPVEVIKKVEVTVSYNQRSIEIAFYSICIPKVPKPYPVPYTVYKHIVLEEQTYKLQAKQDGFDEATEKNFVQEPKIDEH
jgi:hypothetical protein